MMKTDKPIEPQSRKFWIAFGFNIDALMSVCISVAILVWVLYYCQYGYDFTDEGFYLNWISRPYDYAASVSQFGFLYHPLYLLAGGDVAVLRQLNVAGTYILSVIATWLMLKPIPVFHGGSVLKFAIAASISTAAITFPVFNGLWLFPTPSYNWAAFQGLLVTLIGLFLADRSFEKYSNIGWVLIGVGGWVTFIGKPSSAALLVPIFVLYLALSRKRFDLRKVLFSIVTAAILLLLTAYTIDGGIKAFWERNIHGLELGKVLVGVQSASESPVFRLEPLTLSVSMLATLCFLVLLTVSLSWVARWQSKANFFGGGLAAALLVVSAAFFIVHGGVPFSDIPTSQKGLLFLAVAIGILISSLLLWENEQQKILNRRVVALIALFAILYIYTYGSLNNYWVNLQSVMVLNWTAQSVIIFILFAVLAVVSPLFFFPYIYVFGTGNPYWVSIPSATIFTLFAVLTITSPRLARPSLGRSLLGAGFVVQLLAVLLILDAFDTPYRNPQPITRNESSVVFEGRGSLKLAKAHAEYLQQLADLAHSTGFERDTPLIDLTGLSPGALYYLGARSPGVAWTLGGYPGSADVLARTFKYLPCEYLVQSWLLMEPQGPIPIRASVLKSFGTDSVQDYEIVGSVKGPSGVSQQLARPLRRETDAVAACRLERENAQ